MKSLFLIGALALALTTVGFAQPKAEQPAAPNAAAPSADASIVASKGVLVGGVQAGSPAEKAGIVRGDIIIEANGASVDTPAALRQAIDAVKIGSTLALKLMHGDAAKTVSVSVVDQGGRPWIGVFAYPAMGGVGPRLNGPGFGNNRGQGGMRRFGYGPGLPNGIPAMGAWIASVAAGGPAEKAGLKQGDVILSVDGTAVDARHALADLVGAKKVGDSVTLSVQSGGQAARDVKVPLEKNPSADTPWLGVQYTMAPRMGRGFIPGPGMQGMMFGAVVSDVAADGPAAKAGLKANDVITKVEGAAVTSPQQVADAVGKHKPGDAMVVTVYRRADGKETDITVTLGQSPSDATKAFMGVTMTVVPGRGMMPRSQANPPAQTGPTPPTL
jgi:S1-C subfamily serine protease